MNKNHLKLLAVIGCSITFLSGVQAATKVKAGVKQSPAQHKPSNSTQNAYVAKVKKIESNLIVLLGTISTDAYSWTTWSRQVEINKEAGMDNPESEDFLKRDLGDKYVDIKAEVKKSKAALTLNLPKALRLLVQLRSISPVPKSLKTVDDNFGKFSRESETAMNKLKQALVINEWALGVVAREQASKAFKHYNAAKREMARKTDHADKSKKYVDG